MTFFTKKFIICSEVTGMYKYHFKMLKGLKLRLNMPGVFLTPVCHRRVKNNTATQRKGQKLFQKTLCFVSYVFWGTESEFEVKIAPDPISFKQSQKTLFSSIRWKNMILWISSRWLQKWNQISCITKNLSRTFQD